jgi:hypothetical protein
LLIVLRFVLVAVPDCERHGFIPGRETIIPGKNSSEIQGAHLMVVFMSASFV